MTRPTCAQRRSRQKSFLWKRRKICRWRETEYRAPVPGSPLWARSASRTYTLGRSAPSAPAGCRAYTLRRHLVRGLRPMDKRRVIGRRRADSRFSPFRNFAGGHRPSPRRRNSRGDTPRASLFSPRAPLFSQAKTFLFWFAQKLFVFLRHIRTFLFWFAQKLFRGGKWQTSTTRSTWPPPSGCSRIRPAPRNTQVPKTWRRPDKTW